jgi:hypothetical protein
MMSALENEFAGKVTRPTILFQQVTDIRDADRG